MLASTCIPDIHRDVVAARSAGRTEWFGAHAQAAVLQVSVGQPMAETIDDRHLQLEHKGLEARCLRGA